MCFTLLFQFPNQGYCARGGGETNKKLIVFCPHSHHHHPLPQISDFLFHLNVAVMVGGSGRQYPVLSLTNDVVADVTELVSRAPFVWPP